MRLMLVIPVFILFLSNVPFIQRIPLDKAISRMQDKEACTQQKECSRQHVNLKVNCSKEESDCDATTAEEIIHKDNCCQQTETTCVCICCFQFAAPVQVIAEYQFNCCSYSSNAHLFIPGHIKDPYIAAPWQPPDWV